MSENLFALFEIYNTLGSSILQQAICQQCDHLLDVEFQTYIRSTTRICGAAGCIPRLPESIYRNTKTSLPTPVR
ncbi:MAG: hypothetical protein ACK5YR_04890 [Pirellula sp.]